MRSTAKQFYDRTQFFLVPAAIFLVAFGVWLLALEKGGEVLLLNEHSKDGYDPVVLALTQLGLGSIGVIVGLLLVLHNVYSSMLTMTSLAWVGFFTFVTKRILFFQHPRPLHYFLYDDFPRFIHDVPLIYYNSFPSGHTMTIFAMAALFAYLSGRSLLGLAWFLLAALVGLSRIYLLQHFGVDVIVGALLGIISAFLAVYSMGKVITPKMQKTLNQSIFPLIKLYLLRSKDR